MLKINEIHTSGPNSCCRCQVKTGSAPQKNSACWELMELGNAPEPCVRKVSRAASCGASRLRAREEAVALGTKVEVARKDQKLKLLNWLDKPQVEKGWEDGDRQKWMEFCLGLRDKLQKTLDVEKMLDGGLSISIHRRMAFPSSVQTYPWFQQEVLIRNGEVHCLQLLGVQLTHL